MEAEIAITKKIPNLFQPQIRKLMSTKGLHNLLGHAMSNANDFSVRAECVDKFPDKCARAADFGFCSDDGLRAACPQSCHEC